MHFIEISKLTHASRVTKDRPDSMAEKVVATAEERQGTLSQAIAPSPCKA